LVIGSEKRCPLAEGGNSADAANDSRRWDPNEDIKGLREGKGEKSSLGWTTLIHERNGPPRWGKEPRIG